MTYLNSRKVKAFSIRYSEHLGSSLSMHQLNNMIKTMFLEHYNKWTETDIGEWCIENDIKLCSNSIYRIDSMEYEVIYYMQLTIPQYEEYNLILINNKLMEE